MNPRFGLIPVFALLLSCHSGTPGIQLSKQSMYSLDTVRMAMKGGDEKAAAKKLYAGSAEIRKDTLRSIALFKESILSKPTAKAYYELAGALVALRNYSEALQALNMAEQLGYTPLANVMFRYAYVYAKIDSGSNKKEHTVRYMELAIQMGFAHPELFVNNNLFPGMSQTESFDAVYNDALRGGPGLNNSETSLWAAYSDRFAPVSLPLTLNKKWLTEHESSEYVAWQYERFIPDMRENRFSRGEGKLYLYIALLKKTPALTVLLYGTVDGEGDSPEVEIPSLHLATYNTKDGTLIDMMQVAGRDEISAPFDVCTIRPDLKFKIQEFKNVYKQNPDDAGYDSSNIAGEKAGPPSYFEINGDGKIQAANAPVAMVSADRRGDHGE